MAIWLDFFLQLFVHALAWCAAAAIVFGAGWAIGRAHRIADDRRRRPRFTVDLGPTESGYVGREPFGE